MSTREPIRRTAVKPYEDYGIFGPDSVTWRVFRYPTSFTVGFQRTVVTEMFDPFLLAAVDDTSAVMDRPAARYDRTLQYVATVAFADSATVTRSADIVFRIHTHIRGIEPTSGQPYDANEPESQLWIHLTQWHSVLLAYEVFGPGPLSPDDEEQYWAECRVAAEFQSIDLDAVPRNRKEMRDYYARVWPRMSANDVTRSTVHHLLNASAFLMEDMPGITKPLKPMAQLLFKKATIATLPGWMRRLADIHQSPAEDAAAVLAMRAFTKCAAVLPEPALLQLIQTASPGAAKIVAPIAFAMPPTRSETVTPSEAWANAGLATPLERYEGLKTTRPAIPPRHAAKDPGVEHLPQLT